MTKDNVIPIGNVLARVPRNSGRVAARYGLQNGAAKGLAFGAGVTGVSSRQDTLPNTVSTPGYAVLDAQAAYDFGHRYTIEFGSESVRTPHLRSLRVLRVPRRDAEPAGFCLRHVEDSSE